MEVFAAQEALPQVVIVGGGFGGLSAAKELAGKRVRVTLVDRTNHHLFQWACSYLTFNRGARLIYGTFRPNKEPVAASTWPERS
jgi:2-polyprenyl-6-methoxyphenol hydroxylase-like FAD-dependent oxidoreductase